MALRLGTSVPTDARRVTQKMGSARTVLHGRARGLFGNEGRDGWRNNLTVPPARRNLVHTERNALPDQVDLGSGRRRPTSTGLEILEWRSSHELALAWTSEVLFAAAVLLVPAVIALYRSLCGADRPWVGFGCGVFAAIIPTVFRSADGARATSVSRLRHNP